MERNISPELAELLSDNFDGQKHFLGVEEQSYFSGNKQANNFQEEGLSELSYSFNVTTGAKTKNLCLNPGSYPTIRKPELITFDTAAPVAGQTIIGNGAVTTGSAVKVLGTSGTYHYITAAQVDEYNMAFDGVNQVKKRIGIIDAVLSDGVETYVNYVSATDFLKIAANEADKPLAHFLDFVKGNASRITRMRFSVTSGSLKTSSIFVRPATPFAEEGDRKIRLEDYFSKDQMQNDIIDLEGINLQFDDQSIIYMTLPASVTFTVTAYIGAIASEARKLEVVAKKLSPKPINKFAQSSMRTKGSIK